MRSLAALVLLLAACGSPPATPAEPGWHGADVHLVDGRWIGTETACSAGTGGLECRVVVEQALATLPENVRANVTKAAEVALPETFVLPTGEVRTPHLGGGIETGRAVVVDLADGTRRVVGLICYLPYAGDGSGLAVTMVTCSPNALDDWGDGNVPRSYPPGTKFG